MSRALDVEGSDAIPSRLVGLFQSVSQSVRNASVTVKRTQLSQCAALASPCRLTRKAGIALGDRRQTIVTRC
jgi:hypothetical protein